MIYVHDASAGQKPIKLWADLATPLEDSALQQLKNTASLSIVAEQGIAVMPDVHFGIGATVGSVVPTIKAIIPAAVGVDIGCGMSWYGSQVPVDAISAKLPVLRHAIERTVPVGAGRQNVGIHHQDKVPTPAKDLWVNALEQAFLLFTAKHPKLKQNNHPIRQLGTLGGGNHFIEIVVDQHGMLGVMLHSGSRGIGNLIGRYFIERAKMEMEIKGIVLPDMDLAYLEDSTPGFTDYCFALRWAQRYAELNRDVMLQQVVAQVRYYLPDEYKAAWDDAAHRVSCHHNYVSWETHYGQEMIVTRKGAVSAKQDEMVIIPGSMGARSFIAKGKGNAASYNSCSHGAGRRMSRGAAKKAYTVADLEAQTAGVECRKDAGVLDEIPGAYKDIDDVMAAQADLVEPVYTLKQLICVKG